MYVVGKTDWRSGIQGGKAVTSLATWSDEAFAILCLENIWDSWIKRSRKAWRKTKGNDKLAADDDVDPVDELEKYEEVASINNSPQLKFVVEGDEADDKDEDVFLKDESVQHKKRVCLPGMYTKEFKRATRHEGWSNYAEW